MDEQTTQQSSNDVSADGLANAGYEEEPLQAMPEELTQPESEEKLAKDGVRLREDGNLEFGDEFFTDIPDSAEEETKAPNYYTDDELRMIPFEQWDLNRLNGDVGKFAYEVQRQLQQRVENRQSQAWENRPLPSGMTEPKAYRIRRRS